jgi:hypothetical protein
MIFEPGLLTAAIAPQQTRKRYKKDVPGIFRTASKGTTYLLGS